MHTGIVLLRGVNVGGKNILPMAEFARDLRALGLRDVATYIQSGNAVVRSTKNMTPALGPKIASAIEARHGFRPQVLVLDLEQLRAAVAGNPFPEAAAQPKTLHLFFLGSTPAAVDLKSLESIKAPSEAFLLGQQVFYLRAPEGIGRSRLAAGAEKLLGVTLTARNWSTVHKLLELADGGAHGNGG